MRSSRIPVGEVRAAKCLDLLLTVLTELDVASRRCCRAERTRRGRSGNSHKAPSSGAMSRPGRYAAHLFPPRDCSQVSLQRSRLWHLGRAPRPYLL